MDDFKAKKNRVQQLNEILADTKNRSYFVVAITFLFFVLFMFLGVVPAYSNVLKQSSENEKIGEGIDSVRKKRDDLQLMLQEEEDIAPLLSLFDNVFPEENNPQSRIIQEIFQAARPRNLSIRSVTFNNDDDFQLRRQLSLNSTVQFGEVRMDIRGGLNDLLDFISFVESSRRIFNIESLSISGDAEGDALEAASTDLDEELFESIFENFEENSDEFFDIVIEFDEDGNPIVEEQVQEIEEEEEEEFDIVLEEELLTAVQAEVSRFRLSINIRYFYWKQ